jgi:hypothetical protein
VDIREDVTVSAETVRRKRGEEKEKEESRRDGTHVPGAPDSMIAPRMSSVTFPP